MERAGVAKAGIRRGYRRWAPSRCESWENKPHLAAERRHQSAQRRAGEAIC